MTQVNAYVMKIRVIHTYYVYLPTTPCLLTEKRMFEIANMVVFVILQVTLMALNTYYFKQQYLGAFIMSLGEFPKLDTMGNEH